MAHDQLGSSIRDQFPKDSEIMELDFLDNSDNVGDSTVQVDEVSVYQGPVGVTSAILVME